ncbi:SGNH/GDSL hydrolase family protein [Bythopirellula polymerisocia]|uniref:GDSL-like Lipase/Acylhydrolase n=1 Tax=Bythopirellula polymerisocia TaxID=2528003 RepID=A0A5C6CEN5_9BACT|nr:SGNH/GDSL hydrolase family protein [Bythopirellula polymerisocia]TWU21269.1 GDSL-like Lipase/Acylhydrolase [Bythopirellula polymerisocia]
MNQDNRRDFLISTAGLTAASWATLSATTFASEKSPETSLVESGDTILFQGDSITDAGRNKEQNDKVNQQSAFGNGYAWMAASEMLVSRPEGSLRCFNRGISGNKVYQLAERWQIDCLDLKPNLLSILIGVNDIWHKLNGDYDGTVEVYETDLDALIARTKAALPDVKLIVCEPFVLKVGKVNDSWFPEFDEYRSAAKRVSDSAGARFVAFQAMFDRAIDYAPPEYWAADGVHPTNFGAALMAHTWLQTVGA